MQEGQNKMPLSIVPVMRYYAANKNKVEIPISIMKQNLRCANTREPLPKYPRDSSRKTQMVYFLFSAIFLFPPYRPCHASIKKINIAA